MGGVPPLADNCLCATCGQQNRKLARFCRSCGAALEFSSREESPGQSRDTRTDLTARVGRAAESAPPAGVLPERGPWLRRSTVAIPIVIATAAAAIALAGWQIGWPTAVFGARHTAATQRLRTGQGSPTAAPTTASGATSSLPTESPSPSSVPSSLSGPAAVVQSYFAAINSKAYKTAWRLGGNNFSSSYSSFVDGFSTTASDMVTILSVNGSAVTVSLAAKQTNGTVKTYQGTYTVTGGVITNSNIQQVG